MAFKLGTQDQQRTLSVLGPQSEKEQNIFTLITFFCKMNILCASVVGVLGMKTFGKPCFTQSRANERQILMVSPVTEPDYLRDLFTQVFFKHSTTFPVFLFNFFALFSNVLLFKFRLSIYLPEKQWSWWGKTLHILSLYCFEISKTISKLSHFILLTFYTAFLEF